MSAESIAAACAVAGIAAALCAWGLAGKAQRDPRALDDERGPQKIHRAPIPRVGGIAVAAGLVAALAAQSVFGGSVEALGLLLACMLPGFIWGLIEDMSKRGAVLARLVLTGTTPMLAYVFLDARIAVVGVPGIDGLLALHAFSFVFTVFAVTGIAHAMNVIDGLNGLSAVTALFAALGLAVVAGICGDGFVLAASLALAASVAGFMWMNFPGGRIFLGDGGAYLIGLLLAELSVLLVHGNPQVSPWFPLVLLAYPVCETLFSIWRRRIRGVSPGSADGLHLHTLVYRRIVRWWGLRARRGDFVVRNSLASLYLWILPALCTLVAVALWQRTWALQLAALGFALLYLALYRSIVRFGVPRWLVVRRTRGPSNGTRGRRWNDDETVAAGTGGGK